MKISNAFLLKFSYFVSKVPILNLFEWYLVKTKVTINPNFIKIGKDVFFGGSLLISAEVDIGDRVMFGPECMIIGGDHVFERIGQYPRYIRPCNRENCKKIIIEEDVWFGSRVIVLKNAHIGKGAVIGAGSVVTKRMPPYCVSAGNPCTPIRKIFTDDELSRHLKLLNYSDIEIQKTISDRNSFFI